MKSSTTSTPHFFSASILLLFFGNIPAVLNFVFQAMMRRTLNDADFGLMNALFYLTGFLAIPVTVYSTTLARHWAELTHAGRAEETERSWWALMVAAGAACVVITLIALACVPLIAWWLQTSNLRAVGVTVIFAGINVVLGLALPLATARQWFGWIAVGSAGGALLRILIGYAGIHFQTPLSGAVAATCVSGVVLTLFVALNVRWPGRSKLLFRSLAPSHREWRASLWMTIALLCILGTDLLIVRRVFVAEEAGVFSQVITLARIIFFLIGPISIVVFPKTATSLQAEETPREGGLVRRALMLGAVILLLAAAAICVLAPLGFRFLRGASDPEMVRLLRIAVWCLIPLSLCQLVIPSLFARRQERYLFEFTLLSAILPVSIIFCKSLDQVFAVEGITGLLLLGFIVARLQREQRAG